jgi:PEP-CTERM motif-containing protein
VKNSILSWLPSGKVALRLVGLVPVVLASLLVSSVPASADIITISSESFAPGVDISHALDGVTLQRITQQTGVSTYAPIASPVITSGTLWYGPLDVTIGGFSLGYDNYESCYNNGTLSCLQGAFHALELIFDAPTSYVSIVGDFGNDAPAMLAYDSDGSLIAGCGPAVSGSRFGCVQTFTSFGPGQHEHDTRSTLSITSAQGNIARVVWGSFAGAAFAHQISYSVPEPGTLLLLGIGMVGTVGRVLRKRRRVD